MLKISLPGIDVKTAATEDLAVDSTKDTLKLLLNNSNPYFGEILVVFKDNPAIGTHPVFVYKHNLGNYTPFYYIFFDISKSSKILESNTSYDTGTSFSNDVFSNQLFKVVDTGDGFKLNYIVSNNAFDMTSNYFSFKYFVYVNDGI